MPSLRASFGDQRQCAAYTIFEQAYHKRQKKQSAKLTSIIQGQVADYLKESKPRSSFLNNLKVFKRWTWTFRNMAISIEFQRWNRG